MFYELLRPNQETQGVHEGKWFVETKERFDGHDIYGALFVEPSGGFWLGPINIGLVASNAMYYFDTEYDAYCKAAVYYEEHSKIFPYHTEWIAALNRRNSLEELLETVDESESQIMEFE